MTDTVPQIVFDWAQRAFEGEVIKHEGSYYLAADSYSYSYPCPVQSGTNATMDIMLMATKRRVKKIDASQVSEKDQFFVNNGIEGTRKVYVLND